jgi:hypothetical protein
MRKAINKGMTLEERADDYLWYWRDDEDRDLQALESAYKDGFKQAIELAAAWILENTDEYGAMYGADEEMPKDILEGVFPYSDEDEEERA